MCQERVQTSEECCHSADNRISDAEIEILKRWTAKGAVWPEAKRPEDLGMMDAEYAYGLGTENQVLQRHQLDFVQRLNQRYAEQPDAPAAVEGIIESSELAFRMQQQVPELLDLATEPQHIQDAYGIRPGAAGSFARQCLLARKLCEAGVRFVEIRHGGWDHHNNLHATLLALPGLDHENLTFNYGVRDFRLTDVEGNVVREIFA